MTWLRARWPFVGALICAVAAAWLYDDHGYSAAGLLMTAARLGLLLSWGWVSGWLMDQAHGTPFKDDRPLIVAGNFAVAFSRSVGHAVIFIPGALCILKI